MKEFFVKCKTAADYRNEAKKICDVCARKLAFIYLVYFAIMIILAIIDNLFFGEKLDIKFNVDISGNISLSEGLIAFVFAGPFAFSLAYISKNVFAGLEPKIKDLLEGIRNFTKAFVIYVLQIVFIILWAFLLVVPGIIKMFSYSMSYFVSIDNPNLTSRECIKESQKLMNGHKWEFFCLLFSYVGWLILSLLTFGILLLWVTPRIQQATYLFYLEVSGLGSNPK